MQQFQVSKFNCNVFFAAAVPRACERAPSAHRGAGTRVVSARDGRAYPVSTVAPVARNAMDVRLPPRLQEPGRLDKPQQRQILRPFVRNGRDFLAPRPDREAPLEDFDAALRAIVGYNAALLRAGFRNPPGVPLRATKKFVDLFGDFGLTNRERNVFLREGGETTDDEAPRRPRIGRAERERRAWEQRAIEEVRNWPEFETAFD